MNFIKMIWALTALMLPLQCLAQDYRKDKPQSVNYLQGKILSVIGDSEAAGDKNGIADTYCYFIAQRNCMKVHNLALNGQKLCNAVEGKDWPALIDNYDRIPEESDYILVHIGYNDSFDPLEPDESLDSLKFKGAFNGLVKGLRSRYPHARIGVICPYYFNNEPTRIARAEWLMRRCRELHVQCIDGCAMSGLSREVPEQADMFRDEAHLTIKGHRHISYIYENFMRGL